MTNNNTNQMKKRTCKCTKTFRRERSLILIVEVWGVGETQTSS